MGKTRKVLLIGGSLNQTTIAHSVARHLGDDCDCYFTPYYCDTSPLKQMARAGLLDFTVVGGKPRRQTIEYLEQQGLKVDPGGAGHDYDLVITLSDLVIQKNIRGKHILLIQEGMTDPENLMYHFVRWFKLPRYLASTATTGLSDAYDYFCVASEGYREHFIRKGVRPEKLVVTGIPNFDHAAQYLNNVFPHRGYVLVATSDMRETLKFDNRRRFLRRCLEIADGRPLIFKLHPNEQVERATREIDRMAPGAVVYASGNTNHMIANCDVLITQHSSAVYIGLALGKEVHSYFDVEQLRRLVPEQNGGSSARKIAHVCHTLLRERHAGQPARALDLEKGLAPT